MTTAKPQESELDALRLFVRTIATRLDPKEIGVIVQRARKLLARSDCIVWDDEAAKVGPLPFPRPHGPSREGSRSCQSGSLASGGKRTYCTCDSCY